MPRPTLAGSQYTASSKSRASSPSMVTSGTSVRSTRCLLVGGPHLVGQRLRASAMQASENSCGTPYLRTAISISMPGSSISPSTSLTRPTGWPKRLGGSVSSHHHHLARLGRAGGALGNQHVLAVALVFGRDEPDAAFVQQAADDRLRRALDDLDHAPLGAALAVVPHDARLDAVLVQHRAHFVGGQVDVGFAVVAHHEAVAVAMSLDHAFDFIEQVRWCCVVLIFLI